MSGDELAAAIYAKQGYLVLASADPLKIGQVTDSEGHCSAPLIVKANSNYTEYSEQASLESLLRLGVPRKSTARKSYERYFYRVEAAD